MSSLIEKYIHKIRQQNKAIKHIHSSKPKYYSRSSFKMESHSFSNILTWPSLCQVVFLFSSFDNKTSFLNSSGFRCNSLAQSHRFLILQLRLFLLPCARSFVQTSLLTKTLHFLTPLVVAAVL